MSHESGIGLRPLPQAGGSTRIATGPPVNLLQARQRAEDLVLAPNGPSIRRKLEAPVIQRKSEAVAGRRRAAGGAPQFEDNPVAAIGFVLQNIAAGFQGKELPSERAARAAQQGRALRLRGLGVRINALKFGIEKCGELEGEERKACIAGVARAVGDLDPDFASTLEATIGTPKALDLTKLISHPVVLEKFEALFPNDDKALRDFFISEQGQKIAQGIADKADRPVLEETLDEIFDGIAKTLPLDQRANVGVSPSMIRELDRQGKLPPR